MMVNNPTGRQLGTAEQNWVEMQLLVNARGIINAALGKIGECDNADAAALLLRVARRDIVKMLRKEGEEE